MTANPSTSEAALVDDLKAWLSVPQDVETTLNRANKLRRWMTDILLRDHDDTVVSHHTLRMIQADIAKLTSTDPKATYMFFDALDAGERADLQAAWSTFNAVIGR
jgi:ribosomal protein L17